MYRTLDTVWVFACVYCDVDLRAADCVCSEQLPQLLQNKQFPIETESFALHCTQAPFTVDV